MNNEMPMADSTGPQQVFRRVGGHAFRLVDGLLPHSPISDRTISRLRFWRANGRFPLSPSHPRATFNDFIYRRVTSDRWSPLERVCIDKEYGKLMALGLCPLVKVAATRAVLPVSSAAMIRRAETEILRHCGRPEVAKPTHGSGSVLFLRRPPSPASIRAFCETAGRSYYRRSRERQYKGQERKIIIEEDLSAGETPPLDYKFFCVRGKVLFCQVDLGRFVDHRRMLLTPDFRPIDVRYAHDRPDTPPPRPQNLPAMLQIAEELSRPFCFARIDLYSIRDAVYFGEFTFAPEGGAGSLSNEAFGISVMEVIRDGLHGQEPLP